MDKIFAVAMVFRRTSPQQNEDHLMLHIVRDCETKGDAFLKAFDKEKSTLFPDGGCIMKAVVEISIPVETSKAEENKEGDNGI